MCDERERLIEYVYGEGAPTDRQQIEAHLGDCHVCRAEVSGLRSVRDDLLAWSVPKHEPIWRPVVPPPAVAARPAWPTWALLAAASAVFTTGLAGGIVARGWGPETPPATSAAAAMAPAPEGQPRLVSAATADDLARLEAEILARLRSEVAAQLRNTAPPPASLVRAGGTGRRDETEARLAVIEEWMDDQIRLNNIFNGKFGSLNSRTSSLSEQHELSRLQRISLDGGMR